ncbi:P-loop containing nucleoside triphosphate hydrolase protein [Vararia minispora EC-137]|uniref:P-loop containing nucleoside triphosphate hydrolase protein n=1 Tax=Vararia minispora EC-137 TaxID=1314806 RepID=A0ACB8QM78_9AGAM|nr:P-loop containing nucleoside triphosphate hydrolase protein [Vararia minispora EC-137]
MDETRATQTKLLRMVPFTPKRVSTVTALDSRITTPSGLPSAKKFKSVISTEARSRTLTTKLKPPVLIPSAPSASRPRTPTTTTIRPKTPTTPRQGTDSPIFDIRSEMDVSRVDPEENLVDYQNVEAGDISAEIDEATIPSADYGSKDKVLVSIRVRPTEVVAAWDTPTSRSPAGKLLKLQSHYHKNPNTSPPEFTFDEVLTGSANKPVYNAVAKSHVIAAMEGFNAVVFAYGQTASGKTFTLSGDEDQPGIIPRALKDVFAHIRRTPTREYLLRVSYLEIYNETIHDLLAPPATRLSQPVQIQGSGSQIWLAPLREEVVTSLKGAHAVLERGWAARRTASTDWNERSSRSHSVFRVVIESRERSEGSSGSSSGRQTPGLGARPPTPGGARLQAIGGRSVQTSVLSLIDLAGSERATSDKDRTREGKYINTSLLTLGSVISTLAENAAKGKTDHVPFRNSKLTRMLQPSLSGDARISVICTINPDVGAIAESTSTLLFAQRIKKVQLNAKKKEVVDTEALLERYRQEIEDLKKRLAEREAQADAPASGKSRRLSAREQEDESKAMRDLNARIRQLTNLILTSQTVDENRGDESRPASPQKIDFDMPPYQLQQELLSARREIETQANQILSLEAALLARPAIAPDAPEAEKDKMITEQTRTIRELEMAVRGYEDNLGAPLRQVREDVEREWEGKVEAEKRKVAEKEAWAEELVKQLEKEKKMRAQLEEERRVLAAFVSKFDSLTSGGIGVGPIVPRSSGPAASFNQRQKRGGSALGTIDETNSPVKIDMSRGGAEPSLLEEQMQWDGMIDDESFELVDKTPAKTRRAPSPVKDVLARGRKENLPV